MNLAVNSVKLAGVGSKHDVRDGTFENLSILGENLTRNSSPVSNGQMRARSGLLAPLWEDL